MRSKGVFSTFPDRGETKKHPWDRILQFRFHAGHFGWAFPSSGKGRIDEGRPIAFKRVFFQLSPSGRNEKTPLGSNFTISVSCHHFGWAFPSSGKSRIDEGRPIAFKRVFFQLSPSGRNEKTPLGSNFTISVSCHHFGWAFPSSGKSRIDEGRPIAFKRRFFNFPHRGETKKHPWDRILQFSFHATILGGLFQAAEKCRALTKVVQLRSKGVFSTFPDGRNEKTPLGSNFTISVSCHHFGWAFPSSGKCRIDEGRPIAFKRRFFNFPHRGETKKHPWDRILQFRFHATILGGLFQAAEKAGLTKVVQLRSKGVFSTFPIGAKRKNTLGIEFYNFGFMPPFWVGFSKQRKKPALNEGRPIAFKRRFFNFPHRGETKKHPWDRILQFRFHAAILGGLFQAAEKAGLTKVVQLRSKGVFSTFPIGAKRKNTLGIEFYNFVSCHHFGWAFPSSGKSRIDEGRPIAFKTRFFNFPHRGETKKHPWDRILQFRFHATILGGLFQAAEKAGLTKVVQLRSKRVFSTFPIGAKRKNTLGIEFYNFGFMPPFWVGFSKQRKKPD